MSSPHQHKFVRRMLTR